MIQTTKAPLWIFVLVSICFSIFAVDAQTGRRAVANNGGAGLFKNNTYQISIQKNGSLILKNKDGAETTFRPNFTILYRFDNPGLSQCMDSTSDFIVPCWNNLKIKKRTPVQYEAAEQIEIKALTYQIKNNVITWIFPNNPLFDLTANVTLSAGGQEPKISFHFTPKKEAWYSIAYSGSQEMSLEKVESIWQPLVWQEKRFPSKAFLSMEHMCPIPAVMVGEHGAISSLIADPAEVPFRLPVFKNSRFGLSVRNEQGNAQTEIFSPVLGSADSKMKIGGTYGFSFRLLVQKASWMDTYRYIAKAIYDFHDYRENGTASLNETLENMIDLAMDDHYSGWNEDLKAFDYSTDVRNTVKLVSALHPLSLAMITDNPEIYARRALPMMEFLLSREKYLFSLDEGVTLQSPSHFMKGPAAGVSELAALYNISQNRSPVFAHYASLLFNKERKLNLDMVSNSERWQDALALYQMTGDKAYLNKAVAKANEYISKRIDTQQTDFRDAHISPGNLSGQFWTDFSPDWMNLLELYEETKDKHFLDAAVYGAKIYASYVWLQPTVPNGEVLINPTGTVAMGDINKTDPKPMEATPLMVPAWRVSQVGLTPEASNTYYENPAVMLTHYAAYMLRLSYYTGDTFFKDIARSAVIGRYTNYPGYDINKEYTTLYQRPDYPLRPWSEITYNQMYYNHIWPHIALVTDYLMADALYKSKGSISFPSHNAEGYAYLHSKIYGDKTGKFYGDKGVNLWMPKGLLKTDNIQANYIAGQGNGNLYLALTNQSGSAIRVKVKFNQDIIALDLQKKYKVSVWEENKQVLPAYLRDNEISVDIKGNGITALRIENVPVVTRFQKLIADTSAKPLSDHSFGEYETQFGKVTGMIISMGKSLTNAYIWLAATEKDLKRAKLYYRTGNNWMEIADGVYPYEFSIPLSNDNKTFEYRIEGETPDGKILKTETLVLKN